MPVSDEKRAYAAKLHRYVDEFKSIFVVGCDNVGSKQMQAIRITLRGKAELLMGKNTTIRKCIKDYLKKNDGHPIAALQDYIVGNVGLVFTNGALPTIRDVIASNKVPAPARVGMVSPMDVWVEPGATGCDPGQTAFFQALNIPTKINKGQLEILTRVQAVKAETKVTDQQAALLQKLNIKPFSYGLVIQNVYENGSVFDPAVLDINDDDLLSKFMGGVSTLAAISLGLGYPTKASIVHSINDAYKTVLAVGLETDYKFAALKAFEDFLANPGAFAVAAAPTASAGATAAAPAAKVEEEKKEEEEDVGGAGGLFGGDDDW